MPTRHPLGFWVLEGVGIFILVTLFAGQGLALVDYDLAVSWGLQEGASSITPFGVAVNKGFAAADIAIYGPLLAIGLVGFWGGKLWGTIALAAALGITAYWPIACLYALYVAKGIPGFTFASHALFTALLLPFVAYALWGLVFLYRSRGRLH
jgi:hypothetical protein